MITSNSTINIIIADDQEIFRDGFSTLINKHVGITIVAEAGNGEQLVRLTERFLPDVVLTDIIMPVMDGIEATRQISKRFPQVGTIALSMFNEDHLLKDMIEAGAKGYLLKNAKKEEMISAIESVSKNTSYYCSDTSLKLGKLQSNHSDPGSGKELTEKEKQIIVLICQQFSNKKIADKLYLSIRTIEGYRERIKQKTKVSGTAALAFFAIKNNIVFLDAGGKAQPCHTNPPTQPSPLGMSS